MNCDLKTILYVEDDENIATITKMALSELGGYDVHHYLRGAYALDALCDVNPQLVILDVMMPFMDGPETFKRIREKPEGRNLPIIFMTARAQTHEQAQYMALGAEAVIVKPYDPLVLHEHIATLWQEIQMRQNSKDQTL